MIQKKILDQRNYIYSALQAKIKEQLEYMLRAANLQALPAGHGEFPGGLPGGLQ